MKNILCLITGFILLSTSSIALADTEKRGGKGLSRQAAKELHQAGVDKYLGRFTPVSETEVGEGWTKHTYPNSLDVIFGDGPLCIAGTEYSVFTKTKNPKKVLIFMQGGGACWDGFYNCNIRSEAQEPPPEQAFGIWDDSIPPGAKKSPNPLADYSIVYMPYCDGSAFTGDNDVPDANFPFGPARFHRGLENTSAGVDMAKGMFPKARKVVVAGSSAGGVGATSFAPLLTRLAFGNKIQLSVFNDAGPVAIDLNDFRGSIPLRAHDWNFGQYYPASCTDCSDMGQQTALIKWRLDNDSTIRESFYSTDGDATDRFFLAVPTQQMYRDLIVTEHGKLNEAHPDRYKRFIRSGDDSHTALQTPLFYLGTANGIPLNEWTADFLKPGKRSHREKHDDDDRKRGPKKSLWIDIVEDFVPVPADL